MGRFSSLKEMFKNPSGSYDGIRTLFILGGLNGVVTPVVFQTWQMIENADKWDPVAFCAGYGGMLAAILAGGGLATATKDKGVASALNTTPPSPPEGGQP